MSIESNKKLVQQFYDAINRSDFEALRPLVHKDFVFYNQRDRPFPGVDGLIESEEKNFASFKTWTFPVIHMVAEGDKVAVYMHFDGQGYQSSVFGIEPNGKNVSFSLMHLLTIKDGLIIEKRAHFDVADIRRQLS